MRDRNYSVEQWLTGMVNDLRFYPVNAVRAYIEDQLDDTFAALPKFGPCIAALGGYHIAADEKDGIVSVNVYDSTDSRVYSASWELRN